VIRRGLAASALAALFTGLFVGCAKERGASSDVAMPEPQPQFNPGGPEVGATDGLPPTGPAATTTTPAWRRRAKAMNVPSASSTGATGPTTTNTTTPAVSSSAVALSPAELFRAQDACLDHCDQFACMKIAEAYKAGTGVPSDPLAGRRYAIHACMECGAPGLAIVDACPSWGIDAKKTK